MKSTNSNNETDLFQLVSEGDEIAFHKLFEQYRSPFFGVCMQMSGSREVSEEVVQETFIRIWEKRSYLKDLEHPRAYLYKLFHNVLFEYFRHIAAERKASGEIIRHYQPETDEGLKDKLRMEAQLALVQNSLKHLTPQQALVFRLIKQEGLSRREAAAKLGISPNTARNLLAEAMRTLRQEARGIHPLTILLFAILEA